jgi:hypothetical protein
VPDVLPNYFDDFLTIDQPVFSAISRHLSEVLYRKIQNWVAANPCHV